MLYINIGGVIDNIGLRIRGMEKMIVNHLVMYIPVCTRIYGVMANIGVLYSPDFSSILNRCSK